MSFFKVLFRIYAKVLIKDEEQEKAVAAMKMKRISNEIIFKSATLYIYIKRFQLDCDAKKSSLIIPEDPLNPYAQTSSHKLE